MQGRQSVAQDRDDKRRMRDQVGGVQRKCGRTGAEDVERYKRQDTRHHQQVAERRCMLKFVEHEMDGL